STSIWGSGKRHHMRADGFIEVLRIEETPEERHARVRSFIIESLRERNARPLKEGTCSFCAHQLSESEAMITGGGMTICSQCREERLRQSRDSAAWKPAEANS